MIPSACVRERGAAGLKLKGLRFGVGLRTTQGRGAWARRVFADPA